MMKRMEWQNKKESNEHYNLESWENREIEGYVKRTRKKMKRRKGGRKKGKKESTNMRGHLMNLDKMLSIERITLQA